MPDGLLRNAGLPRRELSATNAAYVSREHLPHAINYGETPVVVYRQSDCGRYAILKRPEWRRRLEKVHSQRNHSLPKADWVWREFDSSMSSDALLMNIFCYPGVTRRRELSLLLGREVGTFRNSGFCRACPWSRAPWREPKWT